MPADTPADAAAARSRRPAPVVDNLLARQVAHATGLILGAGLAVAILVLGIASLGASGAHDGLILTLCLLGGIASILLLPRLVVRLLLPRPSVPVASGRKTRRADST